MIRAILTGVWVVARDAHAPITEADLSAFTFNGEAVHIDSGLDELNGALTAGTTDREAVLRLTVGARQCLALLLTARIGPPEKERIAVAMEELERPEDAAQAREHLRSILADVAARTTPGIGTADNGTAPPAIRAAATDEDAIHLPAIHAAVEGGRPSIAVHTLLRRRGGCAGHEVTVGDELLAAGLLTARRHGLARPLLAVVLREAVAAAVSLVPFGPVRLRLPREAAAMEEVVLAFDEALVAVPPAAAESILVEIPLAAFREPATHVLAERLAWHAIGLVLGDWDPGLEALEATNRHTFAAVTVDATAVLPALRQHAMSDVWETALAALSRQALSVTARNVDTERQAEILFMVGVTHIAGEAANTMPPRPRLEAPRAATPCRTLPVRITHPAPGLRGTGAAPAAR